MAETCSSSSYMPPDVASIPGEVLAVLPTDAYLQLELAYKISCHAYSQQVCQNCIVITASMTAHARGQLWAACYAALHQQQPAVAVVWLVSRSPGSRARGRRCRQPSPRISRLSNRWSDAWLDSSPKCMITSSGWVHVHTCQAVRAHCLLMQWTAYVRSQAANSLLQH
jgi:hypothetical protein